MAQTPRSVVQKLWTSNLSKTSFGGNVPLKPSETTVNGGSAGPPSFRQVDLRCTPCAAGWSAGALPRRANGAGGSASGLLKSHAT